MPTVRKRPNPAVAQAERAAQSSQAMADMQTPGQSSLGKQIANRKRATADKIKKEHPYLIETED